jgi:hypothetical protein
MKRVPAKDFQDLIVPACAWHADRWQKAHQLVLSMYLFSNNFPKNETYGLISQTRRAVISIPVDIVETYTASILDSGS